MLDPEYIRSVLPERMTRLYAELEDDMLRDVARRISKANYLTPTGLWQVEKARDMSVLYKDLTATLQKYSGKTVMEVRSALMDAGVRSATYDAEIYRRALHEGLIDEEGLIDKEMISFLKGEELAIAPGLHEAIGAAQTNAADMMKLTNTRAIQGAANTFSEIVDKNYLGIQTGTMTFDQAMKNSINQLAQAGIQVLNYESGRRVSLEAAVKANLRTSANQATAKLAEKHMDLIGANLVETTSHAGARPEHAEWQGRVFYWEGKGAASKKYPPFLWSTSYGTATGLCGVNCRHSFYPFFEGLSTQSFTRDPAKELGIDNDELYDQQQKQRQLERSVRAAKKKQVIADEMGDKDALAAAKAETTKAQTAVRQYVDDHKYLERSYLNEGIGRAPKGATLHGTSATEKAAKEKAAAKVAADRAAAEKAETARMEELHRIAKEKDARAAEAAAKRAAAAKKSAETKRTKASEPVVVVDKNAQPSYNMVNEGRVSQNVIRRSKTETIYAERHGMTAEQYRKSADERVQKLVDGGTITKRADPSDAEKIIRDGRFKSQFETKHSNGHYDDTNSVRRGAEETLFEAPAGLDPEERPIYGYLRDKSNDTQGRSYGSILFEFDKGAVYDRTTLTFGDSLGMVTEYDGVPQLLSKAGRGVAGTGEDILDIKELCDVSSYPEIQIHGGVGMESVSQVLLPRNHGAEEHGVLEKLLKERGVPYRYYNPMDAVY